MRSLSSASVVEFARPDTTSKIRATRFVEYLELSETSPYFLENQALVVLEARSFLGNGLLVKLRRRAFPAS